MENISSHSPAGGGCRARIGLCEGTAAAGGVEKWQCERERVKEEMTREVSRLYQRKVNLLTQLSTLGPSTIVMEKLHQLKESACDLDQQMSE